MSPASLAAPATAVGANGVNGVAESDSSAWSAFLQRLEIFLSLMNPGEFVVIDAGHPALEGALQVRPYLQVTRTRTGFHAEISSNRYLGPDHRLQVDSEAELAGEGWELASARDGGNWVFKSLTSRECALRSARAIRFVLRLPHPTLMSVSSAGSRSTDGGTPDLAPLVGPASDSRQITAAPVPPMAQAPVVSTRGEMVVWMEDLLSEMTGSEVRADGGGAAAAKIDGVLVVVEPGDGPLPWVHVTALVVENAAPNAPLLRFTNDRTAELTAVQVYCSDDAVFARTDILASPLITHNIKAMITFVAQCVRDLQPRIAAEFGGNDIYGTDIGGYL